MNLISKYKLPNMFTVTYVFCDANYLSVDLLLIYGTAKVRIKKSFGHLTILFSAFERVFKKNSQCCAVK